MTDDGGKYVVAPPDHRARVTRSALWAAWADALGFISELTDERGLLRRLGNNGPQLESPVAWKRRVGGRYGVEMELPAGCYSDDTQLRLSVGRAVTGTGFDVEAFARVELPVWPSYALGGGHSSKAAAKNLARPSTAWFANFYPGWTKGGGNGVAMRIQPHVWSAPDPKGSGMHLLDVLVDGITTHGGPRALFGAVLHAAALSETLATGLTPAPDRWPDLLATTADSLALIEGHQQVDGLWRPSWEREVGRSLQDAWAEVSIECEKMLALTADTMEVSPAAAAADDVDDAALAENYRLLVDRLGLVNEDVRGSATHTVIAALALSAAAGPDARAAAVAAARAVGTDTDTIGTMAAAVSGAAAGANEPPEVLDGGYLAAEAQRFASIAAGEPTPRFSYPDLLDWVAPRTQSDALGLAGDRPALSGLGWCEPVPASDGVEYQGNTWRWMTTDYGQSLLVKQRIQLRALPTTAWPVRRGVVDAGTHDVDTDNQPQSSRRGLRGSQLEFDDTEKMSAPVVESGEDLARHEQVVVPRVRSRRPSAGEMDVDQILEWVASKNYSEDALGYAMRRLAEIGTVEQVVAFSVAVHAAARGSRTRRML